MELTDKRLKEKEGTQRTFVRVICEESWMIPTWVTIATSPLGNWTMVCKIAVIEVNKSTEQTMWSVAPVSITKSSYYKLF